MTSGVRTSRLAESTFESFDLKRNPAMLDAYRRCLEVAEGEAWCCLLMGPPGNGKTHLAVAAMQRYGLLRSMFWKVPDYLDWLRNNAYGDGARMTVEDLTRGYREGSALVVFDDLGTEKATEWAFEQLYRVLDARYEERIPTIITTNQGRDRIDSRIMSRYAAGLVVCAGKDLRRGGGA